jgi:hypothetical protein
MISNYFSPVLSFFEETDEGKRSEASRASRCVICHVSGRFRYSTIKDIILCTNKQNERLMDAGLTLLWSATILVVRSFSVEVKVALQNVDEIKADWGLIIQIFRAFSDFGFGEKFDLHNTTDFLDIN